MSKALRRIVSIRRVALPRERAKNLVRARALVPLNRKQCSTWMFHPLCLWRDHIAVITKILIKSTVAVAMVEAQIVPSRLALGMLRD